jgi:lipoprotein-anchoring transpeptidase ErfK/SrfK
MYRVDMRWVALLGALLLSFVIQATPASAGIVAKVDIATQRMTVIVDGSVQAVWKVSTARRGYVTPRGSYRPQSLAAMHYSKKYHNSPMPHSVFFRGGYAVHGTYDVAQLGRPASHGCIRLAPGNAATLFQLIRSHGAGGARIVVT